MRLINPYLNFEGNAEEAFQFYQSVFGGELFLQRMSEVPGMDNLSTKEKNCVMHVSLPLFNGQILMASDILPSAGHVLKVGNNNYLSISPDSRKEAERLFRELSEEGTVEMPLQDMFWGDYFGSFVDKYGVHWMINYNENSSGSDTGPTAPQEQNKEIIKLVNIAFQKNDIERLLTHCSETVEWTMVGGKTVKGKEKIRQWIKSGMEETDSFHQLEPEQLTAEGNTVISCGQMTMKNKKNKITLYSFCDIYEFENNKISKIKAFVMKA